MKKIIFTALIAVSVVSGAFAKDKKNVNYRASNAFTTEFNEATDVNWTSEFNFDKASFKLDGKQLEAFYTFSGEKIGTTQKISYETLPSKLKKYIAKKYNGYSIKETILFENDNETSYFISAENNFQSVILKVINGHVSKFKTTIKG